MPIYEFVCESCGSYLEVMQSFSDPPIGPCGWCEGRMKKVPSAPAVQFKGSGWYVSDYTRAGSKPNSDSPDAKPAAPASSESTGGESGNDGGKKEPAAPAAAPAAPVVPAKSD